MTAEADITVGLSRLFNGIRLQIIDLMTICANRDMAGQTAVAKELAVLRPLAGHAHDLIIELAVAHQADLRVDMLALDQIRRPVG